MGDKSYLTLMRRMRLQPSKNVYYTKKFRNEAFLETDNFYLENIKVSLRDLYICGSIFSHSHQRNESTPKHVLQCQVWISN